jgi:hypothetical protein
MAQQRSGADAQQLAQLSKAVRRWRQTRAKLSPMPEPLWASTVALARRLGVNPVKSALGLNYRVLRNRVEATRVVAAPMRPASPHFVELSGAQVLGLPVAPGSVLEFSDAHGARLTVRLEVGASLDVAHLVEAFRRPTA